MIYPVNNLMCLSQDGPEGQMDTPEMIKQGIGSVIDMRLKLPKDYITRERMDLAKAQIYYSLMPAEANTVGPLMLMNAICRTAKSDMADEMKVCLHENTDQNVAGFLGTMAMMRSGMMPKHALDMVSGSGMPHQMTDTQKKFLNIYGEYLVQRNFVKDYNEQQVMQHKMMDQVNQIMNPGNQQTLASIENFYFRRTEAQTHKKKESCGCGGGE